MTELPHTLRVRYCETDRMGVAHHGSYVNWFEAGRTDWLRQRGKTYRQMEEEGVFLAVVALDARYRRSVTYDDELDVYTTVVDRQRVSVTLGYRVCLAGTDELIATGSTKLACTDAAGKLRRLPEPL